MISIKINLNWNLYAKTKFIFPSQVVFSLLHLRKKIKLRKKMKHV